MIHFFFDSSFGGAEPLLMFLRGTVGESDWVLQLIYLAEYRLQLEAFITKGYRCSKLRAKRTRRISLMNNIPISMESRQGSKATSEGNKYHLTRGNMTISSV